MDDILHDKLLYLFILNSKDNIQHEVRIFEPTSLEKAFMVERKVLTKNLVITTRTTKSNTAKENNVPSSNLLAFSFYFEFKYMPMLEVIKCNPKKSLSISLIQFLDMVRVKCFVEDFLLSPK